jgi:hypothetical protein
MSKSMKKLKASPLENTRNPATAISMTSTLEHCRMVKRLYDAIGILIAIDLQKLRYEKDIDDIQTKYVVDRKTLVPEA